MSVAAMLIIDDTSPDANTQYPEIALKPVGFTTDVIYLHSNIPDGSTNWKRWLTGWNRPYRAYPIKSMRPSGGGLEITTHFDQGRYIHERDLYHSADLSSSKHVGQHTYLLGTDRYGRSIWSRLVLGLRISILVGFLAVMISLSIGVVLGALGGYFGGWVDRLVMYLVNVLWSIPTLLLVFAIVLALGRGLGVIFLAVGLTMWVDVARIVRGQVIKVREEQFVLAARSIGQSELKILFQHVLPNIIGAILVIGAANFASAILIEAGLSYLGFGVKPPTPSIGNILNEHYGYAITGRPALALIPALVIMMLVLAFNLVGSALRDIFDVRESGS